MEQHKNLNKYFPGLDGIRFLAVAMVLFNHWMIYGQLRKFSGFLGGTGVNIFFVLSGFLICRILLIQKLTNKQSGISLFKSFYLRRVLRIFPLYYLVLMLGLMINIPGARDCVIRISTFTLNIPGTNWKSHAPGFYNHCWSLSVEEQVYIALPLLLMVIPGRFMKYFFGLLILAGILGRFYFLKISPHGSLKDWEVYTFTISCLDCFGLGGLLSWYYCFESAKVEGLFKAKWVTISAVIFFLIVAVCKINMPAFYLADLFWRSAGAVLGALLIGIILYGNFPKWTHSFFINPIVVFLGKISFGIYLIHPFVPWAFVRLGLYQTNFRFSILIYGILFFITTIALAAISWKLFENPINKFKRYFPYKKN